MTQAEDQAVESALEALRKQAAAKRDSAGEKNDVWKASKPGDSIGGIMTRGEWVHTQHGPSPLITIETPEGDTFDVWMSSTVLKGWINDEAPHVGSTVLIVFDGETQNQAGDRSYKNYTCVTDQPNAFEHWMQSEQLMQQKQRSKEQAANASVGYNPPPSSATPTRQDFTPPVESPF